MRIYRNQLLYFIFTAILCLSQVSCGIYSFTGASLSPDIKTISIPPYQLISPEAPPSLVQFLTEKTRDYYLQNTQLTLANESGDLTLESSLVTFSVTPVDISSGDIARKNRLTVGIKYKFTNRLDKEKNFESVLSQFADFDASVLLTEKQDELMEEISAKLMEDLFRKTVADW
ncbi:MAG: hypothetical protein A3H98_13105 [Bacteroidetes bacterium RIFCSPLOWO2_02_FULL_36_8]|nr:MAG: hypothetical protein A3H98_13105 [Bacteroidetes bacterium RIFCSPLOWO2_02_FULL_36_8]OFY68759.1 MAG: hypothetical protein A3G23_02910 [Bacteroidetes bacterium RIFCSPLOWO2_12_FULL_37_12]